MLNGLGHNQVCGPHGVFDRDRQRLHHENHVISLPGLGRLCDGLDKICVLHLLIVSQVLDINVERCVEE